MSHPFVMLWQVNVDAQIARLAARQSGIVTRTALCDAGLSADRIDRRLRVGAILRVHRGVYRHPAVPPSRRGALLAATLAAGPESVASHRCCLVAPLASPSRGTVRDPRPR